MKKKQITCTGCGATTKESTPRVNGSFCKACIANPSHAFLEKPKR